MLDTPRITPSSSAFEQLQRAKVRRLARAEVRATIGTQVEQPYPVHSERFNGMLQISDICHLLLLTVSTTPALSLLLHSEPRSTRDEG